MENFCGLCSEHLSRCKCSERALKEQVVSLCSRVKELEAENARLEKEVDDQCRVNGMGQQREMSLMTELRAKTAECVDIDSKLAAAQNAFRETNRECEALRGALEEASAVFLAVIKLDKTPQYDYAGANRLGPNGEEPSFSARWSTPREMAQDTLRDWKTFGLEKALSAAKPTMPATTPAGKEDAPGEELSENIPIGNCHKCGIPVYTDEGFCGGCGTK